MSALLRRPELPVVALPFVLIACLLFCPVIIDLGAYIKPIAAVSAAMPPTLYLRMINATQTVIRSVQAGSASGTVSGVAMIQVVFRSSVGYLVTAAVMVISASLLSAFRVTAKTHPMR